MACHGNSLAGSSENAFSPFHFSFVTVLPSCSWLRLGKGNGKTKSVATNCELFKDFWFCKIHFFAL